MILWQAFFTILFILSTLVNSAISNEPVDIWNIEKKENVIEETLLENVMIGAFVKENNINKARDNALEIIEFVDLIE